MRVAIDARPLQSASRFRGIGTYTRNIIQNSLDWGRDIVLIIWDKPGQELPSFAKQTFILPHVQERRLGWAADRFLYGSHFRRLAEEVDLIHFTSPFELDMSWPGGKLKVPRIITCYDLMPITHADLLLQGKHKWLKPFYKMQASWLSGADGIVSISNATTQALKSNLDKLPTIKTALLGVPHSIYRPSPRAISSLRERYGLPEEYLLFFSGLAPNKNLDTLIAALNGQDLPPLVIAGSNSDMATSISAQFKSNNIICLGRVAQPDVPALYAAATVFIMPSIAEGFGLPLVEAMACGAPVACSDIPCFHEIADGAAAFFNPLDKTSIAETVTSLVNDPRRRETLQCKAEEIAGSLTFQKTTDTTWGFYKEFIEEFKNRPH